MKLKKKFIISFLISLLIFGSMYGYVWYKLTGGLSAVQKLEAEMGMEEVGDIEEGNVVGQKNLDEVLFLLVGVDTADVKNIKVSDDGATGIRSDTMMLCKVNFKDGSIDILSLPRDSRVPVRGHLDKLNHAHSYGGMKLLIQTIRDYTGLDLDYYVRVDYRAVESLVDAIGGVEIDVPRRMVYNDTTKGMEFHVDLQPGLQVLDGDKAIQFLRFRRYEDGDIDRIKAQQYFLTEMIKQTLTPRNILKLPKILDTYSRYIDTNMDMGIITSGISLAGKLNTESIRTETLPGDFQTINELSYWKVYESGMYQIINELFPEYMMDGEE